MNKRITLSARFFCLRRFQVIEEVIGIICDDKKPFHKTTLWIFLFVTVSIYTLNSLKEVVSKKVCRIFVKSSLQFLSLFFLVLSDKCNNRDDGRETTWAGHHPTLILTDAQGLDLNLVLKNRKKYSGDTS